jgi:hypothetical protein
MKLSVPSDVYQLPLGRYYLVREGNYVADAFPEKDSDEAIMAATYLLEIRDDRDGDYHTQADVIAASINQRGGLGVYGYKAVSIREDLLMARPTSGKLHVLAS